MAKVALNRGQESNTDCSPKPASAACDVQAWTEAASPEEMVGDTGEDDSELQGWGAGESSATGPPRGSFLQRKPRLAPLRSGSRPLLLQTLEFKDVASLFVNPSVKDRTGSHLLP